MKSNKVLNINQFTNDSISGFHTNTLENHLITSHKDIIRPHSHNFFLAVLFTHGTGTHEIDFSSYDVKPGTLFFLNPGQTHHWELSNDTKGYIFFHTQDFFDVHFTGISIHDFPFYYSLQNSPCIYLTASQRVKLETLFNDLLAESEADQLLKKDKILATINVTYIESTRLYLEGEHPGSINKNNYYSRFRQLEDLVEQHYKTVKSPAEYAGKLNVSLKHLNRITQAVAGKKTGEVILDRILLEAKKQLVLQQNSLNEIAFELGYDDYAYFSRIFKKKTGYTPSNFLKKYY